MNNVDQQPYMHNMKSAKYSKIQNICLYINPLDTFDDKDSSGTS